MAVAGWISHHLLIVDEDEGDSTASFIGIVVAISGNVLISLALNCQKLAHRRLEREKRKARLEANHPYEHTRNSLPWSRVNSRLRSHDDIRESSREDRNSSSDDEEDEERTRVDSSQQQSPNSDDEDRSYGVPFPHLESATNTNTYPSTPKPSSRPTPSYGSFQDREPGLHPEIEPLLLTSNKGTPRGSLRGSVKSRHAQSPRSKSTPNVLTRIFSSDYRGRQKSLINDDLEDSPLQVPAAARADLNPTSNPLVTPASERSHIHFAENVEGHEDDLDSDYLKSKLWWLGFVLMNVGESGNFISYAFAPASIVAPLGTFALIANCFFAPLLLKERFRKKDIFGVFLSILGAVTVVLSASTSDRRLDPHALIEAITQQAFLVLTIVYVIGAIILVSLSSRRIGREHVIIDVGACALFGGFTVLSTKAFSSLLTKEWVAIFKEWITYPILVVLIGTGVMQIRHLNRALMKFDSKVVIPAQFVFFNISAIVGSAVLYGDFRQASLHQMLTFLYGCGATFAGVFMLTWRSATERRKEQETSQEVLRNEEQERRERLGAGANRMRTQLMAGSGSSTPARPMPFVRAKTSSLTLSPAQRALLVRSGSGDEE